LQKGLLDLKIRHDDLESVRERLKSLGARLQAKIHQIDTYYQCRDGKLKLRENLGVGSELIYYERERIKGVRKAKIISFKVEDVKACRQILAKITKPVKFIEKVREIYHFDNIKIHLDEVKGLGRFVEFECENVNEEIRKRFLNLISKLGLNKDNLVEGSYSDMV
jgi:predicted adenylyl cyclase CyaB